MDTHDASSLEGSSAERQAAPLLRAKVVYIAVTVATICFVIFKFWLMPVKILGDSMYPTYHNGTRHLLNRMAYWSKEPRRGDVIGLRATDGDIYIKRVIGIPGDIVEAAGGSVFVNGELIDDPHFPSEVPWDYNARLLREDEYFVIGDNRAISIFGAVLRERIMGKIIH